jgi:hypothetical protein
MVTCTNGQGVHSELVQRKSCRISILFYKFSTLNLCRWRSAMQAAAQLVPDSVKTSSSVPFLKHEKSSVRELITAAAVLLLCKFLVPLASSVTCVQSSIPFHSFSHIHLCLGYSVCSCHSLMSLQFFEK